MCITDVERLGHYALNITEKSTYCLGLPIKATNFAYYTYVHL